MTFDKKYYINKRRPYESLGLNLVVYTVQCNYLLPSERLIRFCYLFIHFLATQTQSSQTFSRIHSLLTVSILLTFCVILEVYWVFVSFVLINKSENKIIHNFYTLIEYHTYVRLLDNWIYKSVGLVT